MLFMTMSRLEVEPSGADDLDRLLSALRETYKSVLASARELQASMLGLDAALFTTNPKTEDRLAYAARRNYLIYGDLLNVDGTLIAVTVRKRDIMRPRVLADGNVVVEEGDRSKRILSLYAISETRDPAALSIVEKQVEDMLGESPDRWHYKSQRFNELIEEGRTPVDPPSKEDCEGADVLAHKQVRALAVAMKSASGLLQSDAAKTVPDASEADVSRMTKMLTDAGLATTSAVVICKKSGVQVVRVPSVHAVVDLDAKGVRCTCGKAISGESCEPVIEITDLGRSLLDGSRWYTVLLVKELMKLGVPVDSILTEEVDGGDEMDCIAAISGETVLFELKDKVFSLNNAYSFGAKIGVIRPDASVIMTTEHVAKDVKHHFERSASSGRGRYDEDRDGSVPLYIEGDELSAGLAQLVSRVTRADAISVLSDVLPFGALSAGDLIEALDGAPQSSSDLT